VAKQTLKKSSKAKSSGKNKKAKQGKMPAARKGASSAKSLRAAKARPTRVLAVKSKGKNAVQVIPPADNKPVKNQAGLKTRELEYFRDLLISKRRELLGDVRSMEEEALRSTTDSNLSNLPIHMADMGTDNYEQEFTLGLVEKDRELLREINMALQKIRDGRYGLCEGTGKPITKARLEAKPWARHSIEYTRKMEGGRLRP
jgi:RNA polymerase-binding protein DksA